MASGSLTLCAYYQEQIDDLITKAINTTDERLRNFYSNAAAGFEVRLLFSPIKELKQIIR